MLTHSFPSCRPAAAARGPDVCLPNRAARCLLVQAMYDAWIGTKIPSGIEGDAVVAIIDWLKSVLYKHQPDYFTEEIAAYQSAGKQMGLPGLANKIGRVMALATLPADEQVRRPTTSFTTFQPAPSSLPPPLLAAAAQAYGPPGGPASSRPPRHRTSSR